MTNLSPLSPTPYNISQENPHVAKHSPLHPHASSLPESLTKPLINPDLKAEVNRRASPTSKQSQVNDLIEYAGIKKGVASFLIVLGGLPKTLLNLPGLKSLCNIFNALGAIAGGAVGGIVGTLLLNPTKGAEIGFVIGSFLCDPRTIFNGICVVTNELLEKTKTPTEVRLLISMITNFTRNQKDIIKEEVFQIHYQAARGAQHSIIDSLNLASASVGQYPYKTDEMKQIFRNLSRDNIELYERLKQRENSLKGIIDTINEERS